MIRKLIYFIAWVGIFILSLLGLLWSVSPHILQSVLGKFVAITPRCTRIFIFAASVLYFFLALWRIRIRSKKEDNYEIRTTDGVVTVSPQIITDYVRDSLRQDEDIKNLKVETIRNDRKFNIKIKTELATNGNVAEKSIHIQNKIKREVADKIGINIGEVEVKIAKFINKAAKEPAVVNEITERPAYERDADRNERAEKPEPAPEPVKETAPPQEDVAESGPEEIPEEPKKERRSFFGLFRKKPKEEKEEPVEEPVDETVNPDLPTEETDGE